MRGLDGSHGVMIPVQNVYNLQLSDEIVESISYKSLLSLMYYELFLDIKNGNIPNYCFECNKFYLPDSKHKCKK